MSLLGTLGTGVILTNLRILLTIERLNLFLACINASGNSSRYKLQNCYSEKAGNHNIENGLDAVAKIKGVVAYRVHGGGFAGTILVFVKKNHSEDAQEKFNEIFGEESVFKVAIRKPGATCVAKIS